MKLLYPNSVEKRTKHRDLVTECELLRTYTYFTTRAAYDFSSDFLSALDNDIRRELREVEGELRAFDSSNTGTITR